MTAPHTTTPTAWTPDPDKVTELAAKLGVTHDEATRHLQLRRLEAQANGRLGAAARAPRPDAKNWTNRSAGRQGPIWDECVARARWDQETMTDFVREAITRELARRRLLDTLTDENHYDTACEDRPHCEIPEHHATGDAAPCYKPSGFRAPEVNDEEQARCAASHPGRECTTTEDVTP